ncbi:hypothetical protein KC336_g6 [Hortaea werneckii]|nr:hypothetical protein KC336_g6 [Hortaea werneckii]
MSGSEVHHRLLSHAVDSLSPASAAYRTTFTWRAVVTPVIDLHVNAIVNHKTLYPSQSLPPLKPHSHPPILFAEHPELQLLYHPFLPAALYGPERYQQKTKHCAAADEVQREWGTSEEFREWNTVTYESANRKLVEEIEAAERQVQQIRLLQRTPQRANETRPDALPPTLTDPKHQPSNPIIVITPRTHPRKPNQHPRNPPSNPNPHPPDPAPRPLNPLILADGIQNQEPLDRRRRLLPPNHIPLEPRPTDVLTPPIHRLLHSLHLLAETDHNRRLRRRTPDGGSDGETVRGVGVGSGGSAGMLEEIAAGGVAGAFGRGGLYEGSVGVGGSGAGGWEEENFDIEVETEKWKGEFGEEVGRKWKFEELLALSQGRRYCSALGSPVINPLPRILFRHLLVGFTIVSKGFQTVVCSHRSTPPIFSDSHKTSYSITKWERLGSRFSSSRARCPIRPILSAWLFSQSRSYGLAMVERTVRRVRMIRLGRDVESDVAERVKGNPRRDNLCFGRGTAIPFICCRAFSMQLTRVVRSRRIIVASTYIDDTSAGGIRTRCNSWAVLPDSLKDSTPSSNQTAEFAVLALACDGEREELIEPPS